ncbi:MAG: TonB-dependent receptor [Pseudomonadota bacterium]
MAVFFTASALSPFAVQAQDADDEIDEIVVIGEKFGRSLQDTTTSVALYTGAELEARSTEDLYDVVLRTPNVSQSFGEKGFTIRGVDQRLGSGGGLLINTIVDGASLPNNQSTFFGPYSTWDLGQLEILRGPQGTTQGRNAIGGAIIINSADPILDAYSAKVRGSFAELNSTQLAGMVNIPLITDTLAVRLSADRRETDGWVDNPTRNENYDAREATTARAKVLFQPVDAFSAKLTLSFTDSSGGEDLVDSAPFPGQRINTSDLPAEEGSEHRIGTLELNWNLSDAVTITSLSTIYEHDYVRLEDLDNSPAPLGSVDRDQNDDSFVQELRARIDNGGRWRGLVGLYYGEFDNFSVDSIVVPTAFVSPAFPPGLIFQDRSFGTVEENVAAFGEVEFDYTDRLTLIAGLRYDNESRDFSSLSATSTDVPGIEGFLPPDELVRNDTRFDALLPKFGVRYDLFERTTVAATVQRAYRAGGTGVALVSGQFTEFDPEYTWNYEGSIRSSTEDGRFNIDANVFLTDWEDQILSQITDFGRDNGIPIDQIPVNAGSSRLYGMEVSIDGALTDQLNMFASVGYVKTEFTEFETATAELSGNEFNNASPLTASLGMDWRFGNGFSVSGDINLRGRFFSVIDNDPVLSVFVPVRNTAGDIIGQRDTCTQSPCNDPRTRVGSSVVANLKAGYIATQWSAHVFARNLLDRDYVTQRNAPGGLSNLPQIRTAEPRVVGVEFNWSFGG